MKKSLRIFTILLPALLTTCLQAQGGLLFMDHFNVEDTTNFDGASTAGRLSGTAASETALQAFAFQQVITGGKLEIQANDASGGVRFGGSPRYDWAGPTTGPGILAAGGMEISFDWSYAGNTSDSWIGIKIGTPDDETFIIDAANDYVLLLRMNGDNERFDNRANLGSSGILFPSAAESNAHKVVVSYYFGSFDDGTNVNVIAKVDGLEVANDTFQWDGNAGQLHLELGGATMGHVIDNLAVSTLPSAVPPSITTTSVVGATYHIAFKGKPSTAYHISGSNDLASFPLDFGNASTNASGVGEVIVPLVAGRTRQFYRVEEIATP